MSLFHGTSLIKVNRIPFSWRATLFIRANGLGVADMRVSLSIAILEVDKAALNQSG